MSDRQEGGVPSVPCRAEDARHTRAVAYKGGTVPQSGSRTVPGRQPPWHGTVEEGKPAPRVFRRQPGRLARPRRCPTCGHRTLLGLDADNAALLARVDIEPISELGEMTALLSGRVTYNEIPVGGGVMLCPRGSWDIEADRDYPVLAEHRCGLGRLDPDRHPPRVRWQPPPASTEPQF